MGHQLTMDEPIQFIATGPSGTGLVLNREATEILRKVSKPIVPIAVVGAYRTGKSFLLNLLLGRTNGFPLGPTVEAKTKGIWMWLTDHPGDANKTLLLLDTEGLYDPDKDDKTHDAQIFIASILLSTVLIFNSKGTIDHKAMDQIRLATELGKHVSVRSDSVETIMPTLVWAVRDFHLELKESDGREITSNEYLENCLKPNPSGNSSSEELKRSLSESFKERFCFTFESPTTSGRMNYLDEMAFDDLNEGFKQTSREFCSFILAQGREKRIGDSSLGGSSFATLAEKYIAGIMNGNVCIESTHEFLIKTKNRQAVDEAIKAKEMFRMEEVLLVLRVTTPLTKNMEMKHLFKFYIDLMSLVDLPVSNLYAHHEYPEAEAIAHYFDNAMEFEGPFFDSLAEKISEEYAKLQKRNTELSLTNYRLKLEELYEETAQLLRANVFTCPGGLSLYEQRVNVLEQEYSMVMNLGPEECKNRALEEFHNDIIEPQRISLNQLDDRLTEFALEIDHHRQEIELAEQQQALWFPTLELLQEERDALPQQMQEEQDRMRDEILEQNRADLARLEERQRRLMDQRARRIQEELDKSLEEQDAEIERLRQRINRMR